MPWECGIDGCGTTFDDVEDAVVHQATEHDQNRCEICEAVVPDGYFAIRHTFTEHSRAEYVRAYDATSEDIRQREGLLEEIEAIADVEAIAKQFQQ